MVVFGKNTLEFVRKSTLVSGRSQDWMLAKQAEAAAAVQV